MQLMLFSSFIVWYLLKVDLGSPQVKTVSIVFGHFSFFVNTNDVTSFYVLKIYTYEALGIS